MKSVKCLMIYSFVVTLLTIISNSAAFGIVLLFIGGIIWATFSGEETGYRRTKYNKYRTTRVFTQRDDNEGYHNVDWNCNGKIDWYEK